MTESETREVLENIDLDDLKKHIEKLNDVGIITDLENPLFLEEHDFPHMVIKNWKSSYEEYLRQHGYEGGRLIPKSEYSLINSPVYVLYDSDKYTLASSTKYAKAQEVDMEILRESKK